MSSNITIDDSIEKAASTVGSVWPIHSFVTANPLAGFEDRPFDEAVASAAELLGGLARDTVRGLGGDDALVGGLDLELRELLPTQVLPTRERVRKGKGPALPRLVVRPPVVIHDVRKYVPVRDGQVLRPLSTIDVGKRDERGIGRGQEHRERVIPHVHQVLRGEPFFSSAR